MKIRNKVWTSTFINLTVWFSLQLALQSADVVFGDACHPDGVDQPRWLCQGGAECHTYTQLCSILPQPLSHVKLNPTGQSLKMPSYISNLTKKLLNCVMLILSLYSVEIVNDSSLNFTPDNYGLFLHTEASPRPVLTQTQRLYAPSQGCGKKISTPWQQFNNSSDTLNIYNPCNVPVQLNHSGTNTEQAIKDSSGYVVTHSSDTRENSPD